MGWAKYFEDNTEIMYERQTVSQESICKMVHQVVHISIVPLTKTVESKKKRTANITYQKQQKGKYIVCNDCGEKFIFSTKEQKYFETKGWVAPKRCKHCREIRKTQRLIGA